MFTNEGLFTRRRYTTLCARRWLVEPWKGLRVPCSRMELRAPARPTPWRGSCLARSATSSPALLRATTPRLLRYVSCPNLWPYHDMTNIRNSLTHSLSIMHNAVREIPRRGSCCMTTNFHTELEKLTSKKNLDLLSNVYINTHKCIWSICHLTSWYFKPIISISSLISCYWKSLTKKMWWWKYQVYSMMQYDTTQPSTVSVRNNT